MKHKKRVAKPARIASIKASAEERDPWQDLMVEAAYWQNRGKKLVKLELDADVLAWFREAGPGYQTRINSALREVMKEEKMKEEKTKEEKGRGT